MTPVLSFACAAGWGRWINSSRKSTATKSSLALRDRSSMRSTNSKPRVWNAHAGQRLRVRLADGRVISGVASGLADDGGLRLLTRDGLRAVRNGHVLSARPA